MLPYIYGNISTKSHNGSLDEYDGIIYFNKNIVTNADP